MLPQDPTPSPTHTQQAKQEFEQEATVSIVPVESTEQLLSDSKGMNQSVMNCSWRGSAGPREGKFGEGTTTGLH